jgi:F0F1-type ATP synthase gamma subunit
VGSIHLGDSFTEEELLPLYSYFDQAVNNSEYTHVSLYFNYFKNSISQIPAAVQLMPLTQK